MAKLKNCFFGKLISAVKEALIKSLSAFILEFLCNARNGKGNSELFKESHDEAVHKNSYKSRLYELISASLIYATKSPMKTGASIIQGRKA